MKQEFIEILKSIEDGNVSYSEIAYLQEHKQEVLNTGNVQLCEWAGITEEEYNKGKLSPDLQYKKPFIELSIDNDGENNALCTIKLDDEQELTLTEDELMQLHEILRDNIIEISAYFHDLYVKIRENY